MVVLYWDYHSNTGPVLKWWSEYQTDFSLILTFDNQTDKFQPFEYWTSPVFRYPLPKIFIFGAHPFGAHWKVAVNTNVQYLLNVYYLGEKNSLTLLTQVLIELAVLDVKLVSELLDLCKLDMGSSSLPWGARGPDVAWPMTHFSITLSHLSVISALQSANTN